MRKSKFSEFQIAKTLKESGRRWVAGTVRAEWGCGHATCSECPQGRSTRRSVCFLAFLMNPASKVLNVS